MQSDADDDASRRQRRQGSDEPSQGSYQKTRGWEMTSSLRGIVHGKTVLLAKDAPPLPDGTEVIVLPCQPTFSGAEIVAALNLVPPATAEDVAELERTIAEAWQPMSQESPFDESECENSE